MRFLYAALLFFSLKLFFSLNVNAVQKVLYIHNSEKETGMFTLLFEYYHEKKKHFLHSNRKLVKLVNLTERKFFFFYLFFFLFC